VLDGLSVRRSGKGRIFWEEVRQLQNIDPGLLPYRSKANLNPQLLPSRVALHDQRQHRFSAARPQRVAPRRQRQHLSPLLATLTHQIAVSPLLAHTSLATPGCGYGLFDEIWRKALETRHILERMGDLDCCTFAHCAGKEKAGSSSASGGLGMTPFFEGGTFGKSSRSENLRYTRSTKTPIGRFIPRNPRDGTE
jgi:hypothetical protein